MTSLCIDPRIIQQVADARNKLVISVPSDAFVQSYPSQTDHKSIQKHCDRWREDVLGIIVDSERVSGLGGVHFGHIFDRRQNRQARSIARKQIFQMRILDLCISDAVICTLPVNLRYQ